MARLEKKLALLEEDLFLLEEEVALLEEGLHLRWEEDQPQERVDPLEDLLEWEALLMEVDQPVDLL